MEPLVSIITPTLDRAQRLGRLLEEVEAQSYPNIEHIVVDGGSSDETLEVLKGHSRPRLRWISERDRGVYDAVNKGFALARGSIVAYLNTDDAYFPYTVEVVVDAFRRRPWANIVYGDLLAFDEGRGEGWINFYPPNAKRHLRRGGLISQPTIFVQRHVVDAIGKFDTEFRLAADIDYWLRATSQFRASKVAEVLALEGHHEERLTSGRDAMTRARVELDVALRGQRTRWMLPRQVDPIILWTSQAFWSRCQTIAFLWFGGRAEKGKRWGGFRSQSGWRVRKRSLLASLLPLSGRVFSVSPSED
jgi:glycosyltransferase involved in cell wall biosynthesis